MCLIVLMMMMMMETADYTESELTFQSKRVFLLLSSYAPLCILLLVACGQQLFKGRFTHSMPFPCLVHAVPLQCRAAKGLECVFPN